MIERHIGTCPKCGAIILYDFLFEHSENATIEQIGIPCPECKYNLKWDFLPKKDSLLKSYNKA